MIKYMSHEAFIDAFQSNALDFFLYQPFRQLGLPSGEQIGPEDSQQVRDELRIRRPRIALQFEPPELIQRPRELIGRFHRLPLP